MIEYKDAQQFLMNLFEFNIRGHEQMQCRLGDADRINNPGALVKAPASQLKMRHHDLAFAVSFHLV